MIDFISIYLYAAAITTFLLSIRFAWQLGFQHLVPNMIMMLLSLFMGLAWPVTVPMILAGLIDMKIMKNDRTQKD